MSKLVGRKYLEKALKVAGITEKDFYNYIFRYSTICTYLIWNIDGLLWELDHLDGTPTKFDRAAWREGKIILKQAIDLPDKESDKFPGAVRRYIESIIQSLEEDGTSISQDITNRKKCLGIKDKKILSGVKKLC